MYYSPVRHFTTPKSLSFDLHVLGAPPAFVLSQDQTLKNYTSFHKGHHFNTLLLCRFFRLCNCQRTIEPRSFGKYWSVMGMSREFTRNRRPTCIFSYREVLGTARGAVPYEADDPADA